MNTPKLYTCFLVLLFLFAEISFGQSISGKVVDTGKIPLEFAAVAIINPKDSILISYANTDQLGQFKLVDVPEGELLFQVHLLGFKTYQKIIDTKGQSFEIGDVTLEDSNILDEVIVTAIVPVAIKKDTVAYNTKAFKVRVDDTVEDLLKKLPGVEVDASGKVEAQGESITKIYVDGKEFFSGDPAIALKNLSADAIKSIEVIDEKSEQARVSGVNDDERKKVINLILKEDKKINDFGKAQVGYGTDDRYLTSLNYNRFSSKLQTSIIGKLNNVNTSGSDISEIISFDGGANSSGFVTTGVGGINLGYELKKDQNINADYFYDYLKRNSGDVYSIRTEFIKDQEIKSETRSRSENKTKANRLNFNYSDRSNKLSSLYIRGGGNYTENEGEKVNTLDRYNGLGELDLQSIGNSDSNSKRSAGSIVANYTKRFNEASKRNISSRAKFGASNNTSFNSNEQINKFNVADPSNAFESREETSRVQDVANLDLNFYLKYTEPLSDNHLLELGGGTVYKSKNDDVNQSKITDGVDQPSLIYTEFYRQTDLYGSFRYKYDRDKFTFSVGANLSEQTQDFGLEYDLSFKNSYTNLNPFLYLRYRPKKGKFMRFRFKKLINLPNINQLSPVVNDFNPLSIKQGNPYLTPEDKYAVSALYINHNFATGFSLFSRISYDYTNNTIVKSETTDPLGVRHLSYENLGNANAFKASFSFGNRIKALGIRYAIKLRGNYNEYSTIINGDVNETQSKTGVFGLSLENNNKDVFDASVGANWNKNYTVFTSGDAADREYLQQTYYAKLDWNITDRFNANSQFKYDIYTDSNFGSDQAIPIWNASLSYALLPSKSLTLMVTALDILNKNVGIVRTSSDNYFQETYKDVLGNYYMFSLTYNLNGNKNVGAKKTSKHKKHRF